MLVHGKCWDRTLFFYETKMMLGVYGKENCRERRKKKENQHQGKNRNEVAW